LVSKIKNKTYLTSFNVISDGSRGIVIQCRDITNSEINYVKINFRSVGRSKKLFPLLQC